MPSCSPAVAPTPTCINSSLPSKSPMCGISGYWSRRDFGAETLTAMTRLLAHRGPDAEGYFTRGPIHLGHRRLAVIDPAGSHQPLLSADGKLALVFNGEIYNFRTLRAELQEKGCVF